MRRSTMNTVRPVIWFWAIPDQQTGRETWQFPTWLTRKQLLAHLTTYDNWLKDVTVQDSIEERAWRLEAPLAALTATLWITIKGIAHVLCNKKDKSINIFRHLDSSSSILCYPHCIIIHTLSVSIAIKGLHFDDVLISFFQISSIENPVFQSSTLLLGFMYLVEYNISMSTHVMLQWLKSCVRTTLIE